MQTKPLTKIIRAIRLIDLPKDIDLVVGIARGGIVPGYLVANFLGKPFDVIQISYRDQKHKPKYAEPKVLINPALDTRGKRIIIVDDRANTGKTLAAARDYFHEARQVFTLAVNGEAADFHLFNEPCFKMPWNIKDWVDFN